MLVWVAAWAAGEAPAALRVVVAGSPPFVVHDGAVAGGLSVDVWHAAAEAAGAPYQVEQVPSVAQALARVAAGAADVAVGPITITAARAETVAFTQPYFTATLAILAPEQAPSMLTHLLPFMSRAFVVGLLFLLLVLVIVGTLTWLAERKANPDHFPTEPVPGIANGVWLAVVTMTTVGYGDRAPSTWKGRSILAVWMLVSMVTASSLTAGLATAFTLAQLPASGITVAEDLAGHAVGVVAGTPEGAFVRRYGARPVPAKDLASAVELISDQTVDAVVFDRPQLSTYLAEHPLTRLRLSEASYEPQAYGFAVQPSNDLDARLDVALLRLRETGQLARIVSHWLPEDQEAISNRTAP